MNQAQIAAQLTEKGVGGSRVKADSKWNFLATESWRKPFGGQPTRKALWEQAQRPSGSMSTNGPGLASTHEWLAMPTGDGKKGVVMRWSDYDQPKPELFTISSVALKLQDLRFSPHNPNILAGSSSVGNSLRIWDLRTIDGLAEDESPKSTTSKADSQIGSLNGNILNHAKTFLGHDGSPVQQFAWNPSVPGIVASTSKDIRIYDIEFETAFTKNSVFHGSATGVHPPITSLSWSWEGNVLGLCSKASITLLDIREESRRANEFCAEAYTNKAKVQIAMVGNKTGPLNEHLLVTSGSDTRYAEDNRIDGLKRVLKLWDRRKASKPIDSHDLGENTAAADLHLEPSTGVLFVVDKNSHGITAFDMKNSQMQLLGSLRKSGQHKFYTIADRKYADTTYGEFQRFVYLDRTECELGVERIYKETTRNVPGLPPNTLGFDSTLYPDCIGVKAPRKAKEWENSNYDDMALKMLSMMPNGENKDKPAACLVMDKPKGVKVTSAKWDGAKFVAKNAQSEKESFAQIEKHNNNLLDHYQRESERAINTKQELEKMAENMDIDKLLGDDQENMLHTTSLPEADLKSIFRDEIKLLTENLKLSYESNLKDNGEILQRMKSLGHRRETLDGGSLLRSQGPTTSTMIPPNLYHPIFMDPSAYVRSVVEEIQLNQSAIISSRSEPQHKESKNVSRKGSGTMHNGKKIQKLENRVSKLKHKNDRLKTETVSLKCQVEEYRLKYQQQCETLEGIRTQKPPGCSRRHADEPCPDCCGNSRTLSEAEAHELNVYRTLFSRYGRSPPHDIISDQGEGRSHGV